MVHFVSFQVNQVIIMAGFPLKCMTSYICTNLYTEALYIVQKSCRFFLSQVLFFLFFLRLGVQAIFTHLNSRAMILTIKQPFSGPKGVDTWKF